MVRNEVANRRSLYAEGLPSPLVGGVQRYEVSPTFMDSADNGKIKIYYKHSHNAGNDVVRHGATSLCQAGDPELLVEHNPEKFDDPCPRQGARDLPLPIARRLPLTGETTMRAR